MKCKTLFGDTEAVIRQQRKQPIEVVYTVALKLLSILLYKYHMRFTVWVMCVLLLLSIYLQLK